MSQRNKRLAILLGAALVVAAGLGTLLIFQSTRADGANPKDAKSKSEEIAVPVEVARAEQGSISSFIESSSTIDAEQSAEVLARIEGLLTSVKVDEGEAVRQGQVLATLDDAEKLLAAEKARLRLAKAEAEYQRAKLSHEQNLLSKHDYQKTTFDRDLAASELETGQLELTYTEVRAPFAGRITERLVVHGKTVKKGDHLFSLADFSSLSARLFLPERDVVRLKPGQAVDLALQAQGGASFKGRIREISPVVDPKTGTVKVTVDVVERSPAVRPGAFVQARIVTDTHAAAVLVPKVAVIREDRDDYVFLALEGKAVKRKVELGFAANGKVEVLDGVKVADPVVVAGQSSLKDQSRIEILK